MALNLQSGGDFTPHIRYMASTSSWTMSGENGQTPFQFTQAVFDLENIQTGWCLIAEGQAPQWSMDADLQTPAPKPQGDGWKRGFKVNLFSKSLFGGEGVREFATSATGAVMGILDLYNAYEDQKSSNAGKLPVVEYKGSTPAKVGKGNTTVPKLEIVKFVDRPAELSSVQVDSAPAQAQPASSGESEF